MHRRINITLPEETVELLEHLAPRGDRSRLIDEALQEYASKRKRALVRRKLAEGARHNAARDLELAEEGMAVAEEAWALRHR